MIYVDYAATSIGKPKEVYDAVIYAMKEAGNPGRGSAGYSLAAGRILYDARETVARFFDAPSPDCVAFTSGITESLNLVLKGLLKKGDHVVTTWAEHNSVLRPLYQLEEQGVDITITDPTLEQISSVIKSNTKAVVMTHGSNVTGEVYAIRKIGEYCKKQGIVFIVDTAQTAGCIPVSMEKDFIDILCFAGHKSLLGPEGVGGVCVRNGISLANVKTGGSGIHSFDRKNPSVMPEVLEAGTPNLPGIAGLAAGLSWIQTNGLQKIYEKESAYLWQFYHAVKMMPKVTCYGKFLEAIPYRHTPTVALNIDEYDASLVSEELWERFEIQTRSGAHCAPLLHEHYQTREQGMVRFSFGVGTTKEEVASCIHAMEILTGEA